MFSQQMRYYADNNSNNYPGQITKELLHNGTALAYAYPITTLNVQSIPGVKFYINGSSVPFIVDNDGYITIKPINGSMINIISFDENSLNMIHNKNGYLIIDYE